MSSEKYCYILNDKDFINMNQECVDCDFKERIIVKSEYIYTDKSVKVNIPLEILKTFSAIKLVLNANKNLFEQLFGVKSDKKYYNSTYMVIDACNDTNSEINPFNTFKVRMAYLSASNIEEAEYDSFLQGSYSILEKMVMKDDVVVSPLLGLLKKYKI